MKRSLAILNLLSVCLAIGVDYVSQALRLNDTTIGEMSAKYDNLFTPANYAFAIWGIIFLGLLAYCIFQIRLAFFSNKASDFIEKTGFWFTIANVLNTSWVVAFMFDFTGISVLIMIGILFSLLKVIVNTNMERWDAPIEIIVFVWWPIAIYAGWIAVATIANVAAYLAKINWSGDPLSESTWTIIMIGVATLVNLAMILKRNLREFALVGVWALIAIYVRHRYAAEPIAITALVCSLVLAIAILIHGFVNRKTNPVAKLMQRLNPESS